MTTAAPRPPRRRLRRAACADAGPNLGRSSRPPWAHADRRGGAETRAPPPHERLDSSGGVGAAGAAAAQSARIACWAPRMLDLIWGALHDPPGHARTTSAAPKRAAPRRTSASTPPAASALPAPPPLHPPKSCVGRRARSTSSSWGTRTSLARRETPGTASGGAARRERAPAPTSPADGAGVPPHRSAGSSLVPPPGTAPLAPPSRLKPPLDPCEGGRHPHIPGGGREGGGGRP